jgi:hypothetical protein
MAFDAGSAVAKYTIDVAQAEQAAAKIKAIWQGIGQSQQPATNGTKTATAEEVKLAQALARTAEAEARRAAATAKKAAEDAKAGIKTAQQAVAEQKLAKEIANTAAAEDRAAQSALRRQQAERRASATGLGTAGGLPILPRTLEAFGGQAIDQVKSGLLGVIGPAALVTAGFGAARASVQSFVDAFKFKAELDQTNASIAIQLKGLRDSKTVFEDAAAFGQKYKLTQQEVSQAIQASVGVIRNSKAPIEDVLNTLLRLQVLSPEQSLSEASLALKELQGGSINSLVQRFDRRRRDRQRWFRLPADG